MSGRRSTGIKRPYSAAVKSPNESKTTLDLRRAIDSARMSFEADLKRFCPRKKSFKGGVFRGSKELLQLQRDEGVVNLLHSLPSSRRKSSSSSVASSPCNLNYSGINYSGSGGSSSGSSVSTLRRSSTEVFVRTQTPLAISRQLKSNNLKKTFFPGEVTKVTPESLMTKKALETLKNLSKVEYVRLWSSPSRYFLKESPVINPDDCFEPEKDDQRSSRHASSGASKSYKDILIRTYPLFAQIIISPSTTGIKNTVNANVCDEICDAISAFEKDDSCRAVLVSGMGNVFCHGIDWSLLTYDLTEKQKKNAEGLAHGIKRLVKTLVNCERLMLVAAVNGDATGLAVSWLPLFDVVYASDKAQFETPYTKLGMIPEACAGITFSNGVPSMAEMTFFGKAITAAEAQKHGLVTSVIWPEKFFEEIVPRLQMIELLTVTGITILKRSIKQPLKEKVLQVIEEETKLLIRQWTSPEFVKNVRQYLRTSSLIFQ